MKLKAGKYKGREIADVPQAYLGWMLRTVALDAETSDAAAVVYFGREWGETDITPARIRERLHEEATAAMKELLAEADLARVNAARAAQALAPPAPGHLPDFGAVALFDYRAC